MIQIKDTLVTLDLIEQFFLCDLDSCKGECCIEGDAGAPISKEEYEILKSLVPTVWDETLHLAGEMSEYSVMARRKGQEWWVGAMNNIHHSAEEIVCKDLLFC